MLNFLLYLNSLVFIAIIVPLVTLIWFLWKYRKQNGSTQKFRYIILWLTIAKLLYFFGELVCVYFIFKANLDFSVNIVLPILIGSIILASTNWYAFVALKKIQYN
jgi:hypothetical protein